jgi:hypothetical protein
MQLLQGLDGCLSEQSTAAAWGRGYVSVGFDWLLGARPPQRSNSREVGHNFQNRFIAANRVGGVVKYDRGCYAALRESRISSINYHPAILEFVENSGLT